MYAIKSRRLVTPEATRAGVLVIADGVIKEIANGLPAGFSGKVVDVGHAMIWPGAIDCHVHINEPGRTEWEGYATATKAAAAGGITTLVDMPLNCSPVTTSTKNLQIKCAALAGKLQVDCGFWGGAIPANLSDLQDFAATSGVLGVKGFMIDSGLDEFPPLLGQDLERAVAAMAKSGKPLLVHAELDDFGDHGHNLARTPTSYQAFLESRPKSWENQAIAQVIALAQQYNCQIHIVHLSSAEALPLIAAAKAAGVKLTVETCPHYLLLAAEDIPDGAPVYKCCPPIREHSNQEALWQALASGLIDFVVSDHSPCVPRLKHLAAGDLQQAWGGISSLQFLVPLLIAAARSRGWQDQAIQRILGGRQAQFLGLAPGKGAIVEGADADFFVYDDARPHTIGGGDVPIWHRHPLTPYAQQHLPGTIISTWLRGEMIYQLAGHWQQARGRALLAV